MNYSFRTALQHTRHINIGCIGRVKAQNRVLYLVESIFLFFAASILTPKTNPNRKKQLKLGSELPPDL
jgi:hypothetical protein